MKRQYWGQVTPTGKAMQDSRSDAAQEDRDQ